MARRRKRIEHDNHDRWLISYADFVTLLFAFFVVMYSISSVNESKYEVFSDSLSSAFTNQNTPTSSNLIENQQEKLLKTLVDRRTARLVEQQRRIQERMKAVADGLRGVMIDMIGKGEVNVYQNKRGVVVDISASTLFNTGEAVLQPAAVGVLIKVAAVLKQENEPLEVEGHTDDVPIFTAMYPSNWELSSARASSVVRMLIEQGIPPLRLSVVGMASNHPVAPNDTPENRARNRRVTITILTPQTERVVINNIFEEGK